MSSYIQDLQKEKPTEYLDLAANAILIIDRFIGNTTENPNLNPLVLIQELSRDLLVIPRQPSIEMLTLLNETSLLFPSHVDLEEISLFIIFLLSNKALRT